MKLLVARADPGFVEKGVGAEPPLISHPKNARAGGLNLAGSGGGVASRENFEFQVSLDAISWHLRSY